MDKCEHDMNIIYDNGEDSIEWCKLCGHVTVNNGFTGECNEYPPPYIPK